MSNRFVELESAAVARQLFDKQRKSFQDAVGSGDGTVNYSSGNDFGGDGNLIVRGAFRDPEGSVVSVIQTPEGTIATFPYLLGNPQLLPWRVIKEHLPLTTRNMAEVSFLQSRVRQANKARQIGTTFVGKVRPFQIGYSPKSKPAKM